MVLVSGWKAYVRGVCVLLYRSDHKRMQQTVLVSAKANTPHL